MALAHRVAPAMPREASDGLASGPTRSGVSDAVSRRADDVTGCPGGPVCNEPGAFLARSRAQTAFRTPVAKKQPTSHKEYYGKYVAGQGAENGRFGLLWLFYVNGILG
jgi:hypothetical protein